MEYHTRLVYLRRVYYSHTYRLLGEIHSTISKNCCWATGNLAFIDRVHSREKKAFFFQLQRNSLDSVHPTASNEYPTTPIYLAALTANNSPAETWGPRRRKDQYGIYEHLRSKPANKNISTGQEQAYDTTLSTNGVNNTNPAFVPDQSNPSYEQSNEINSRF